jgi:hypothetical protein
MTAGSFWYLSADLAVFEPVDDIGDVAQMTGEPPR